MISVVLIDDESSSRATLQGMLQSFCPDIRIAGEAEGVAAGIQAIETHRPDAVFLDIRMQDGTGFDLLQAFPEPDFGIIFTTGYDEFAFAAFENNALHYLLKPIHPDKLQEACDRLREKNLKNLLSRQLENLKEDVQKQKLTNFTLRTGEEILFVKLADIIRLESDNNCTFFFLADGKRRMMTRTIKEFERALPGEQFFRTHQSHIVNREHVLQINKKDGWQVQVTGEVQVPIARRKTQEFLDWMERGRG